MTEIIDMSQFTEARSDQLNADDLLGGPRTITITRVTGSEGDQPISVHYEGDKGKPFKPCKTIRRVLMGVWGKYANEYVGRSMTLYRDDTVSFGGLAVGGIRISHMSHIDKDTIVVVNKSKGKKFAFKVEPLSLQRPAATDAATKWADAYVAKLATLTTVDAVRAFEAEKLAKLTELKTKRPDLHQSIVAAVESRVGELSDSFADDDFESSPARTPTAEAGSPNTGGDAGAAQEGPDDSQRGDGDADAMFNDAAAWIDRYEAACKAEPDAAKLTGIHRSADETAATIFAQFPDLYESKLSSVRPADAPERAGGDMFGGE